MASNPVISKALVKSGAYRDLDKPIILANGELGIYYINAEKILQDNGVWETFGNNSAAMIQYASDIADNRFGNTNKEFAEVIDVLAGEVKRLAFSFRPIFLISGGQRRDWRIGEENKREY